MPSGDCRGRRGGGGGSCFQLVAVLYSRCGESGRGTGAMSLFLPGAEELSEELQSWQDELLCLFRTDDGGHLLLDNAGVTCIDDFPKLEALSGWKTGHELNKGKDRPCLTTLFVRARLLLDFNKQEYMVQNTAIRDYELGAGDQVRASTDELIAEFDPSRTVTSMISSAEKAVSVESANFRGSCSSQSERQPLEALDNCKDLRMGCKMEDILYEQFDVNILAPQMEEEDSTGDGEIATTDGPVLKSASSNRLDDSADWSDRGSTERKSFGSEKMDPEFVLRIRTYGDGDTQTLGSASLGHANPSNVHNLFEHIEERKRKISRYRKKKNKRDFSRKIKYACRKALADSQPRVRGRFARAEECEESKQCVQC